MSKVSLLALGAVGCGELAEEPAAETGSVLSRPQPVVAAGEYLVVGSTAYTGAGYGAGEVVVFDAETGAVVNRLPTAVPNPQRLRVQDGWLYVVETNAVDLSTPGQPKAAGPGAVEAVPVAALDSARAFSRTLTLPLSADDPTAGAPVDLALVGTTALVPSAVSDSLFLLDPARMSWRAPPPRFGGGPRPALGSVVPYGEGFALADFNADTVFFLDLAGHVTCAVDVGESSDLEGAQSIAVDDQGRVSVVLALSGALRRLTPGERCEDAQVETLVAPLGQTPNDLQWAAGRLYVVDSGENSVVAYDDETGEALRTYALSVGANPWHVAVLPDALAVTEWATDGLSVLDLETGEVRWRVAKDAPAPHRDPIQSDEGGWAFADVVVDAPGASYEGFGDPGKAINGVRGASGGSRDVYSLRLTPGEDSLTLAFSGRRVMDGEGEDLAVFENPFVILSGGTYLEPLIVEVSADGETFVAFPHDYLAADERVASREPSDWAGFAGVTPVAMNVDSAPMSPFDEAAGGDRFDLATLPGEAGARVRAEGVAFVRLKAAATQLNPDTGEVYPRDPSSEGPDIDGVAARGLIEAP